MRYIVRGIITTFAIGMLCTSSITCVAQDMYFNGSIDQAIKVARGSEKMVLIEFYAPWSHKSRWNHDVALTSKYMEGILLNNFVVVLIDVQTPEGGGLARDYGVTDYPNMVILSGYGNPQLRIDRTMEPAELATELQAFLDSKARHTSWDMRDLMRVAEGVMQGTVPSEVLDMHVERFLAPKSVIEATGGGVWPIFGNSTITYYNSASHRYMMKNLAKMRTIAGAEKVDRVLYGVYSPVVLSYIIGSQSFDSIVVSEIQGLNIAKLVPYIELSQARAELDVERFMQLIEPLISISNDNEEQFSLLMSLDFVAEHGSRELRKSAIKQLTAYSRSSFSPSKEALIEALKVRLKQ